MRRIFLGASLCACLCLFTGVAHAQRGVRGHLRDSELSRIDSALSQHDVSFPIKLLRVRVPSLGWARLAIDRNQLKNWAALQYLDAHTSLPQEYGMYLAAGTLLPYNSKARIPVAVSLFPRGQSFTATLHIVRGKAAARAAYIDFGARAGAVFVAPLRRSESLAHAGLHCAENNLANSASGSLPTSAAASDDGAPRSLELLTVADYELYQRLGDDTSKFIAAIVNAADLIYRESFGIEIHIVGQAVQMFPSSALESLNPEILLQQFRNSDLSRLAWADAVHLFSGKSLLEQTIGIAYTGAICSELEYRYGLTQYYDGVSEYLIFAHELGHNLGATHDALAGPNIMSAVLDPKGTSFSQFSKSQIGRYLEHYSVCLETEGAPSETLSVRFERERKRKNFYLLRMALNSDQGWLTSRSAEIRYRRSAKHPYILLGQVLVDERGAAISTRLRGEYLVTIPDLPEISKQLTLQPKKRARTNT